MLHCFSIHRRAARFVFALVCWQLVSACRAQQLEPLPSIAQPLSAAPRPLDQGSPLASQAQQVWTPYGQATVASGWTPAESEQPCVPCESCPPTGFNEPENNGEWESTLMPKSLIWHSYLAGPWEPRFASVWNHDRKRGWLWDIALGGRVGIYRYGTKDCSQPDGWQLDMEGGALPQLDPESAVDLNATDYRFGVPITYGRGPYQMKFGFYHISSHLGDEFIQKFPSIQRINFGRNALAWGHSYYVNPDLRVYGEADWAWDCEYSKPWYFQFGFDWAPILKAGNQVTPFIAMNSQLRQELDFSGQFVAQVGLAWRYGAERRMFRVGLNYYTGGNQQFEFYKTNEQKLGLGLWYDY